MPTGPHSPQMFVGLGTSNGQIMSDDSADALRVTHITQDGGRIDDDSANALKVIPYGSSGGMIAVADVTFQSSQAVTSSGATNGATLVNPGARGAFFVVNVSSATASTGQSPSLSLLVQAQDPVSTNWVNLPLSSFNAFSSATGTQQLVIYPGVVASSGTGYRTANVFLPRSFRFQWTAQNLDSGGGEPGSYEFTIGGHYIP